MAWHCLRLGLCTVYLLKAFPQRLTALISPCFSICRWFARTFAGSMPRLHRYDEGLGAWPYHSQTSASSCEIDEKIIENPWKSHQFPRFEAKMPSKKFKKYHPHLQSESCPRPGLFGSSCRGGRPGRDLAVPGLPVLEDGDDVWQPPKRWNSYEKLETWKMTYYIYNNYIYIFIWCNK